MALPPLTVTTLAPGPSIDSAVLALGSCSVPRLAERVTVCGVAKAFAVSKKTVLGAGLAMLAGLELVAKLAQPAAVQRAGVAESAVLETRYEELAS